ncbi:MAG: hypothetical protein LUG16_03750 [Candidatus Gastranaerophilales bacterium]|nr:hypothetical protein [Candidatus Gastranaerophilales bacterium]
MSELKIKPANEIIFNNHFKKLKNYKSGTVIFVVTGLSGRLLKSKYYLLTYIDTLRSDNKLLALDDKEVYMIVFLVSETGEIFTTIRKENQENLEKYNVGEIFVIKIAAAGAGSAGIVCREE